ncbi:hypothetical protein A9R05_01190 [Burkholderia sp. KK1]|nr:hypothetical protein A9R05_01190 [Burkholderia sp. KK1]
MKVSHIIAKIAVSFTALASFSVHAVTAEQLKQQACDAMSGFAYKAAVARDDGVQMSPYLSGAKLDMYTDYGKQIVTDIVVVAWQHPEWSPRAYAAANYKYLQR